MTRTFEPMGSDPFKFEEMMEKMKESGFIFAASYRGIQLDKCCSGRTPSILTFIKRGPDGMTIFRYYAICPKCNKARELRVKREELVPTSPDMQGSDAK